MTDDLMTPATENFTVTPIDTSVVEHNLNAPHELNIPGYDEPKSNETPLEGDKESGKEGTSVGNELDQAKQDLEDAPDSEKQKYYKKLVHMANLEGQLREKSTGQEAKIAELERQLEEIKNRADPLEEYRTLGKRRPKELLKKLDLDSDRFTDTLLGIGGTYEDEPETKVAPTYTAEQIEDLINQRVADVIAKNNTEKAEITQRDRVEKFNTELGNLAKTGDYPMAAKIANGEHIAEVYTAFIEKTGREPTPKEVMETTEKYIKEQFEPMFKTPSPTLTQATSGSTPPVATKPKPVGYTDYSFGGTDPDAEKLRKIAESLNF